jgi:hypothetical protein
MFTCRDAVEKMTDDREGALEGLSGARYRLHVTICPHCRRCRRQLDEAVALAREIPAHEVPQKVMDSAVAAFRERAKK